MQGLFNSRMEPMQTHEEYPKYARSSTKPVVRARNIIDQGAISATPCEVCVDLKQDCYRWEGTFSKCAYCTSKDKKREFCHLPGQEASPAPEKRKRRKITGNIYAPGGDAASTADTIMSGTFVSGTLASATTPFFSGIPVFSDTKSVRSRAPSPEPSPAMTATTIDAKVAPPSEAGSEATLERVTALENQVSSLEAKVIELLVKLDEVSSSSSTTPRSQAAAGGSPTTNSDVTFLDLRARDLEDARAPLDVGVARRATREWVEGPKTPELMDVSSPVEVVGGKGPEHSIEHSEVYGPVDCRCAGPWVMEREAVMPRELDEGEAFAVHDIASRGNLF